MSEEQQKKESKEKNGGGGGGGGAASSSGGGKVSEQDLKTLQTQRERDYRKFYAALGELRIQSGVPKGMEKKAASKKNLKKKSQMSTAAAETEKYEMSEHDKFWALRKDVHWVEIPAKRM